MLYEMVCGVRPFVMPSGMNTHARDYFYRNAHFNETPRPSIESNRRIPQSLNRMIMKCLEKDVSKRFHRFSDISSALLNCCNETGKPNKRIKPDVLKLKADSLNNRAISLLDLGKQDEAYDCWIDALDINKNHLETTLNKSYFSWQHYGDDPFSELHATIRFLESDLQNNQQYWLNRSLIEHDIGLNEFSRKSADKANLYGCDVSVLNDVLDADDTIHVLEGHGDNVNHVAIDSLRKSLISASNDNLVKIWDIKTKFCIRSLAGHTEKIVSVSIGSDDVLFSASVDGVIKLWNLNNYECIKTITTNIGLVETVCYSCKHNRAVIQDKTGSLFLYDLLNIKVLNLYFRTSISSICCNDKYLCFVGNTVLMICNILDGEIIKSVDITRIYSGADLCYPCFINNKLIIAGNGIFEINIDSGEIESRISSVRVSCIGLSTDQMVTGNYELLLRLFSVESNLCCKLINCHPGRDTISESRDDYDDWFFANITSIDISSKLMLVAFTFNDNFVRYCRIDNRPPLFRYLISKPCSFTELSVNESAYNQALKTATSYFLNKKYSLAHLFAQSARDIPTFENDAHLLELIHSCGIIAGKKIALGACSIHKTVGYNENNVTSLSLLSDEDHGTFVVAGNVGSDLNIYSVPSGEKSGGIISGRFTSDNKNYKHVAVSSNGKYLVSIGIDSDFKLWQLPELTESQQFDFIKLNNHKPASLKYLSNGCFAFFNDSKLYFFDVDNNSFRTVEAMEGNVLLSNDGGFIVIEDSNHKIFVFDVLTEKIFAEFEGEQEWLNAAIVINDGKSLLVGGWDCDVVLWDIISGSQMKTFSGHNDFINDLAVTSDQKYLFSCSNDFTIRVWNIASGVCLRVFDGHTDTVNCLAITSNDRFLISGSNDGTVRFWELNWEWEFSPE
jgi:WD40 repeat protein